MGALPLVLAALMQVSVEDALKPADARVGDHLMITFLRSKNARLEPGSDDIARMKQAGVSERVLSFILAPARGPEAARTAPQPVTAPLPVVLPAPRTVYPSYPRYVTYDYTAHDFYNHHDWGHHGWGHHGFHHGHN